MRGLAINIPPAELRDRASPRRRRFGKVKMRVDAIVCDDSELVIGTDKPDKDPRVFRLKHVVLRDLGPNTAWPYDAILTNPIPRGEIHAVGTFGPWDTEAPGNSNVSGKYTFDHADLNTINGLAGILSSTGNFDGQLDHIVVHGKTETPNFSLDTANHPMPLTTEFRATVDGTSGDTYLERIDATLGGSQFLCKGAVVNVKGKGHAIHVTADVADGQIGDFLQLAIKTRPAAMSGLVALSSTLDIDPGEQSVTKKLKMKGEFSLRRLHFTDPEVEDKVDILSLAREERPTI